MEVGAVKQAYNNEVIHLKKKLNQAKIQVIHKLTRKAKTFAEKKCPEKLKEKLNRKAKSAVNEVLIIKKITNKELAKFAVTHKGELKDYLNKPEVNKEKACARLLLHKTLEDKYDFFRSRFSNMPIEDLVMSREERRKIKKEEKEKQKLKKKAKEEKQKLKAMKTDGDWKVEDLPLIPNRTVMDEADDKSDISMDDNNDASDLSEKESDNDNSLQKSTLNDSIDDDDDDADEDDDAHHDEDDNIEIDSNNLQKAESDSAASDLDNDTNEDVTENKVQLKSPKLSEEPNIKPSKTKLNGVKKPISVKKPQKEDNRKKLPKKVKENNKQKNFAEKIMSKKFKKDIDEKPVAENKIVDPFFVTATGDKYMSLAEPRAPDEILEVHRQGNRQMRRAKMFGHELKFKPRKTNNYNNRDGFSQKGDKFNRESKFNGSFDKQNRNNSKFDKQNGFINRNDKSFANSKPDSWQQTRRDESRNNSSQSKIEPSVPEKLHPSWEAKKKKSGILPFEGKKIVFD
ncbi:unnamed protein product [Plutella xylostella]|uniref:(diamondback moth) hypothetical protein n=1 Tax=Plutella xylostella TaxID=51655 RepID=A0A8S4FU88_PLUXY|nr:unnamed protein product [Plutella xylostella]